MNALTAVAHSRVLPGCFPTSMPLKLRLSAVTLHPRKFGVHFGFHELSDLDIDRAQELQGDAQAGRLPIPTDAVARLDLRPMSALHPDSSRRLRRSGTGSGEADLAESRGTHRYASTGICHGLLVKGVNGSLAKHAARKRSLSEAVDPGHCSQSGCWLPTSRDNVAESDWYLTQHFVLRPCCI